MHLPVHILLLACAGTEPSTPVPPKPVISRTERLCEENYCSERLLRGWTFEECMAENCPPVSPAWSAQIVGASRTGEELSVVTDLSWHPGGHGKRKALVSEEIFEAVLVDAAGSVIGSAEANTLNAPQQMVLTGRSAATGVRVEVRKGEAVSARVPASGVFEFPTETVVLEVRDAGRAGVITDALEARLAEHVSAFGASSEVRPGSPWPEPRDDVVLAYRDAAWESVAVSLAEAAGEVPLVHEPTLATPFALVVGGWSSSARSVADWTVEPTSLVHDNGLVKVKARVHYEPEVWQGAENDESIHIFAGVTVWEGENERDSAVSEFTFSPNAKDATLSFEVSAEAPSHVMVGLWRSKVSPCESPRNGCAEQGFVLDDLQASWPDMRLYYFPAPWQSGTVKMAVGGHPDNLDTVRAAAEAGASAVLAPFGGTVSLSSLTDVQVPEGYVKVRWNGGDRHLAVRVAEQIRTVWPDIGKVLLSVDEKLDDNTIHVFVGESE